MALWAITDDERLSAMARELIQSPRNAVWVSAVSVWEIAIKHTLGREIMPISGKEALGYFRQAGYLFLAIQPDMGLRLRTWQPIIKILLIASWSRRH